MSMRASYPNGECPDCGSPIPAKAVDGSACVACGHVFYALTPAGIEAAADYFGITNVCADRAHPLGIHRHGTARYVRRP